MIRVFLILMFLGMSPVVTAAGMLEAEHAMRAGNYAEAYCIMRPMAEKGDAEAQYNLGWMYHNGYGLAVNDSLALEWWRRASGQGHIDASFSIATIYHHGAGGVSKDSDKAIDYFLTSARSGHEDAILILRSMLIRDDVAIRDRRLSVINEDGSLFGEMLQVKARLVNVREDANLEAGIVTRLQQGQRVLSLDRQGEWSQVALLENGQLAWIYSSLLETLQDQPEPQAVSKSLPDAESDAEPQQAEEAYDEAGSPDQPW